MVRSVQFGGGGVTAGREVARSNDGEAHGVLGSVRHQLQVSVHESEDPPWAAT